MRAQKHSRLALAALLGAGGVLAAVDLHLLQSPVDISLIAPPGGTREPAVPAVQAPITALDKKTPEQFAETAGRPLFHPSRRPVQRTEATAAAAPRAEPPAKLRLIGIVRAAEQPPRALIRFADEPTGKWLAEGGELKGWRVRKINQRSVVVESGKRTHELTLTGIRPAAPAVPAPPSSPPPVAAEPEGN